MVVLLSGGAVRWEVVVVVVWFSLHGVPHVASEPVLNKFPERIAIHL